MQNENKNAQTANECKSEKCISCCNIYNCQSPKDEEGREWKMYRQPMKQ